jgi:hypothetical protein
MRGGYIRMVTDELCVVVPAYLAVELTDADDEDIEEVGPSRSTAVQQVVDITLTITNTGASVVTLVVAAGAVGRFARRLYDAVARRARSSTSEVQVTLGMRGDVGEVRASFTVTGADGAGAADRAVRQISEAMTSFIAAQNG